MLILEYTLFGFSKIYDYFISFVIDLNNFTNSLKSISLISIRRLWSLFVCINDTCRFFAMQTGLCNQVHKIAPDIGGTSKIAGVPGCVCPPSPTNTSKNMSACGNDSHRISANAGQRISHIWKGNKISLYLSETKEKKKERKESDGTPYTWEGAERRKPL